MTEILTKKVLVTGSRDWDFQNEQDLKYISDTFDQLCPNTKWTLIHGGCRGADLMAAAEAKARGMDLIAMPITTDEWKKYGKFAGPKRNMEMVDIKPDVFIIFHHFLKESKGTRHCVEYLLKQSFKPLMFFNGKPILEADLKLILGL